MNCQQIDLIERSEKGCSNLAVFQLFANVLKNGVITFIIFAYSFLGMILINCQISKRWI